MTTVGNHEIEAGNGELGLRRLPRPIRAAQQRCERRAGHLLVRLRQRRLRRARRQRRVVRDRPQPRLPRLRPGPLADPPAQGAPGRPGHRLHRRRLPQLHVLHATSCTAPTAATASRWEPIFDRFGVDLVVNGHNHCYERTHPAAASGRCASAPRGSGRAHVSAARRTVTRSAAALCYGRRGASGPGRPTPPGDPALDDPLTTDLSPQSQPQHRVLPMAGRTHGNRSPVTCHLRCGDACFMAAPNTTETSYFRDVAATALSRRAILGARYGGRPRARRDRRPRGGRAAAARPAGTRPRWPLADGLRFTAIAPVAPTVDDLTVPPGFEWDPIIRWGDPLFEDAPTLRPDQADRANARPGSSATTTTTSTSSRPTATAPAALLVCNHEYTNEGIMFPPGMDPAEVIRTVWAAHGMSVVELERRSRGRRWRYVQGRSQEPADHHRHGLRRRRPRRRLRAAEDRRRPAPAGRSAAP